MAVIELVVFRLNPGVDAVAFARDAGALGLLLRDQPGYMRRALSRDEEGEWTDHVVWHDMEAAEAAARDLPSRPQAGPFFAAIDPTSVRMSHQSAVVLE